MAESIDEQQRLQRGIVELFSPVTGPTRRSKAPVRFGLGEFDLPGMFFSHWAVIRGLVWAFQEVAPAAWSEIKDLAQEAVDGMDPEWIKRVKPDPRVIDEPDWWDQLFLAHAAIRSKRAGFPLEMPGLRPEAEEIAASAHPSAPLVVPKLPELQAWRAKWNLADDRSLFTPAVVAEAVNDTNQFRPLSATNKAWVTFASLLASGSPNASKIPGFEPSPTVSLEAALLPPYPQSFRFEFPRLNLFFETAASFKTAARDAFKRELDAHIDACYTALSTQEVAPVPVKREPDDHFRWYIRYQVLWESLGDIADAECVERATVSLAVQNVVELAGVPQREPKRPGRPKKHPPSTSELSS